MFSTSCEILHKKEMLSTVGEVCFEVEPSGAELYVDGEYAGYATGCYTLDRGPHTIEISRKNFISFEREIYVGEAQQTIRTRLAPSKD